MSQKRLCVDLHFRTSPIGIEELKQVAGSLPVEIDFRSDKLFTVHVPCTSVQEASYLDNLSHPRDEICSALYAADLQYTYSGCQIRVAWDSNPFLDYCVSLCPSDYYGYVHRQNDTHNVYLDPFNPKPAVFVGVIPSDQITGGLAKRQIDSASFCTARRFVALNPRIYEDLAWRPMPGGCVTVSSTPGLKVLFRWMPPAVEENVFETLCQAVLDDQVTEMKIREPALPVFCKSGLSICWLSGWSYPPRMVRSLPLYKVPRHMAGNKLVFFDNI